jgi:UDP-arabinose 4-epimerase
LSRGHRDAVKWGPLIIGDVRDQQALKRALTQTRAVAVLHFAGLADVGESVRDPLPYYDVNIGGALALASAMTDTGVDVLIFSSTCAVYGTPEIIPIAESTPLAPINPYGVSKMSAERIFADAGAAYGLRTTALRYFNAAGADPDGEIGERHEPETHLIPLALRAALLGTFKLKVMGEDYPTPDGTAVRDYIHVADLALAHVWALRKLLAGGPGQALNLGVGRGFSVAEIVNAVERVSGHKARRVSAPRRAGDPPILIANPDAAVAALGWNPVRTAVDDIIADALKW